jgi:hypothetical protein
VDITANPSLGDLLNQLRGAKVRVSAQAEQIEGTVLGVEKKQKMVGDKGQPVEVRALNLLVGAGLRSLLLDDVQKVELDEPQLQLELVRALQTLAQARDQDTKPVTIEFQGKGERRVRLGYVVEVPIWKTTYRLILPDAKGNVQKAMLQGWAIIENQTDKDWRDVRLSLVSGRPISFIQPLYEPLYLSRPVVQPELYASLRPQTYDAGLESEGEAPQRFAERDESKLGRAGAKSAMGLMQRRKNEPAAASEAPASPSLDPTAGVSSVAAAEKLGELFQYSVGQVSLPRQRSAMIPIVNDPVEIDRVSIYNACTLAKHPLHGVRLKNTTGNHLLQGPITVLDSGRYGGDAQVDSLPPAQERWLTYAIDLEVRVNGITPRQEASVKTERIVKGVLSLTRKNVTSQDYLIENKSDRDKAIVVEHPIRAGWQLVDSPKPMETTEAVYRFRDSVGAGKSGKLTVKEQLIQGESLAILPADIGNLELYTRSGEIPRDVRDALIKAIELKHALVDSERQIAERQKAVAEVTEEQKRIRANMGSVSSGSQYHTRLLAKLNEQESGSRSYRARSSSSTGLGTSSESTSRPI